MIPVYQPFPQVIPVVQVDYPLVTPPSATRGKIQIKLNPELCKHSTFNNYQCALSFDLHVLGMPPAFILSQDQTLLCISVYLS